MKEDLQRLLENTEPAIQKNKPFTKEMVALIRNGETAYSSFPNRKQRRAESKKKSK